MIRSVLLCLALASLACCTTTDITPVPQPQTAETAKATTPKPSPGLMPVVFYYKNPNGHAVGWMFRNMVDLLAKKMGLEIADIRPIPDEADADLYQITKADKYARIVWSLKTTEAGENDLHSTTFSIKVSLEGAGVPQVLGPVTIHAAGDGPRDAEVLAVARGFLRLMKDY